MKNQNERLEKVIGYLMYRGLVSSKSTQKDLAEKIDMDYSNISKALKGEGVHPKTFISKINKSFGDIINENWVFAEEGTMLKSDIDISTPIKTTNQGVPYYNVDFIGGFDLVENDQTTTPDYYIDFQKYNSADCWCNVTGHSMEPSISNGDIIALKEIKEWRIFLPFGEIYAIVTSEHRTIKKVTGSLNPEKFLLIPLNSSTEFQPQEIPISIIMKVYKVLGCVKKF